MIPDKMYIHRTIHLGLYSASEFSIDAPGEKEYISKDALMEWAKKEQSDSTTILADDWWQKVIDQINNL